MKYVPQCGRIVPMLGVIGIMPATYASPSLKVVYVKPGIGITSGVQPNSPE